MGRAGFVPREVLREMGRSDTGLEVSGGVRRRGAGSRATALLAEELGARRSAAFAITVLVHTDMASPHLVNAGTPEQIKRFLPK